MKLLTTIAMILLFIGGLNWGLMGLFDIDLVALLFGSGTMLSKVVYILVGLSALVSLPKIKESCDF
ncbi:MAG: DUF378 domain-containing protein [Alphaproteobacteria bacterium]|nr:DUF378 domain-containing protein [Alphaproteobacteria bacterium]